MERVKYLLLDLPREKGPLLQENYSQEEDMKVHFSLRDQEKGYVNDEAFSIDEEKEEEEMERSSITMAVGGDLFLLGYGGEEIDSTRRTLVSLQ